MANTALVIVDVQNDFCPGGSLACAGGDKLAPTIAAAASIADIVVASRDWHPADHCSFVEQGGEWPSHCVAGTPGARFHDSIVDIPIDFCVYKGQTGEEYSAMTGEMQDFLEDWEIEDLIVCGIATDVCVKATVLEALGEDFGVTVPVLGTAGTSPENYSVALAEMFRAGAFYTGPAWEKLS